MGSLSHPQIYLLALLACGLLRKNSAFLQHKSLRVHLAKRSFALYANVVSKIVVNDESSRDSKVPNTARAKPRLSRPERKAKERKRKQERARQRNQRRKHNFNQRKDILEGRRDPGEGRYDLHSSAINRLTPESTADDVIRAIKRAQNLHDAHDLRAIERFLLEQTDETFAYGYRGSLLSRLAVAALHMNNHRLARKAMDARRRYHRETMMPMEAGALIRGLLRVHNVSDALFILDDELPLPINGVGDPDTREILKHRARAISSIASRHFFEGEPTMAVRACQQLAEMGALVRKAELNPQETKIPWTRILKGAAQCESGRRDGSVQPCLNIEVEKMPCDVVYAVLDAMATFPSENSDRIYELVSNALVRRVLFVTGAVNMDGCPPTDRGEVAFIGRSNVGKSSLINMICSRKALAYTSKRPGKTQQFNFFTVNDKPGREKEIKYGDAVKGEKDPDSFYIVDLPGFGYAKVPEKQRQQWSDFMRQYISDRTNLRVLFHLVDARHGPTDEDKAIMKQVGEDLPSYATYVVVLTKADKNVKGASTKNPGKVSGHLLEQLRSTMKESGVGSAPVLLSSSETKLGRDNLWRYVRRAAEG